MEPSPQDVEDKLVELTYVWGDVEAWIRHCAEISGSPISDEAMLAMAVRKAFRVEVIHTNNGSGDDCTPYVLLFDVGDQSAREASREVEKCRSILVAAINEKARTWHNRDNLVVRVVPLGAAVEGQVCRRVGEEHPRGTEPTLDDVPDARPESAVGLTERDRYWLTPIEVPFYDALRDTGLTFAVQPWIQGTEKRYRLDFLVFYGGNSIAVELDGHEYHKSKEDRSRDAERDRWFAARQIQTVRFTGSQVYASPQGCVKELLDVLRAASARP